MITGGGAFMAVGATFGLQGPVLVGAAGKTTGELAAKRKYRILRSAFRWTVRLLLGVTLLVVIVSVLLLLPAVQQGLASFVAKRLSAELGNTITIGRLAIRPFGPVELQDVYISDLHGDTLIGATSIHVGGLRIHPRSKLINASVLELRGARFKLTTAMGDSTSNLTNLFAPWSSTDTSETENSWSIHCGGILVDELHFSYHDANVEQIPFGVDFKHVDVRNTRVTGDHLRIAGDSISATLRSFSFREQSGLQLERLAGITTVSPRGIVIDSLELRTPRSELRGVLHFRSEGWADFNDFTSLVNMQFELAPSRLEFADVAYFAPGLQGVEFPISISGRVRGTVNELRGRGLEIGFGEHSFFKGSAELTGLPDIEETFMLLDIAELRTDHLDLARVPIPPFISGRKVEPPAELVALGDIGFQGNFTGFFNSFTAYGAFTTRLGELRTDLSYKRDTLRNTFALRGRAATTSFSPGALWGVPALGLVAANVRIDASGKSLASMSADIEGDIPLLGYGATSITGIKANGRLEPNSFDGELHVQDENLVLDFKGLADLSGRWPVVDFQAYLQHADLRALALLDVEGYNTVSMLMMAKGRLSPDSLVGVVEVKGISYCNEDGEHDLGDILLRSSRADGENLLELDANFADAEVRGTFLPTRLPSALANVVYSVFPALRNDVDYAQAEQHFSFELRTKDTEALLSLFVPGLSVDSGGVVRGYLNSRTFDMGASAQLPAITIGRFKASEVDVLADKTLDVLAFRLASERQNWGDSVWFAGTSFIGKAYQDELDISVGWATSSSGTSGNLDMLGEVRSIRSVDLSLLPSYLHFGRGNWSNTRTARFHIESSTVHVEGLELANDGQRILLEGSIGKDSTAALSFKLDSVSLENLTPFLSGPVVKGVLHADGRLFDVYNEPYVLSELRLDSVMVQDKPVGDLLMSASWGDGRRAIDLNGTLNRGPIKALDFNGALLLDADKTLDVALVMDRFDLGFIDPYLPEGISELQGQVTGTLTVTGPVAEPRMNGELDLVDAGLRIDYLNTLYRFTHRVKVAPDMFALDFVNIRDEEGNVARIGGTILHKGLSDWNYNVWGSMDRFLVMNTTIRENELYYGKAYGSGDIELSGFAGSLDIIVDARTMPGTDIHFPIGGSTEVSAISFVRFLSGDTTDFEAPPVDLSGITLDLKVEVTPDAQFELIFDPTVGDILSGRGRGNMEMSVTQTNEFSMRGQVEVSEGDYLFTLRNVVNKRFQLQPGGRITWFGDPFDALLDLYATYRVRAPLYDIMFEKNDAFRKRVPVDVVMHLQDKLMNPEIGFQVRLPTVDESVRTQVASVLSTEQEMNRQVFALIVLNRFVQPPNYTGQGTPGSGSALAGTTTSELLSNQVSNWLSKLSNDFDLGVNYRPGDNITQDELELAVSTQLFDERLLVSTNVGVQYGAQAAQSTNTLVGDFQVEYLLTNDGKLRLKAFSISNDRNLNRADQALTTQGAGVAYREEFDDWGEFWRKVFGVFRKKNT